METSHVTLSRDDVEKALKANKQGLPPLPVKTERKTVKTPAITEVICKKCGGEKVLPTDNRIWLPIAIIAVILICGLHPIAGVWFGGFLFIALIVRVIYQLVVYHKVTHVTITCLQCGYRWEV